VGCGFEVERCNFSGEIDGQSLAIGVSGESLEDHMSIGRNHFGSDEPPLRFCHVPGVGEENNFEAGEVEFFQIVEMDGFDCRARFVERRDGAVDCEWVSEFVRTLDGPGEVEGLGIEDGEDVASGFVLALVVLVENFVEALNLGHQALVGPPAGVVGGAEVVIPMASASSEAFQDIAAD